MFAIIETGGKQYRVTEGQSIKVEKLDDKNGQDITIDHVLMVSNEGNVAVGSPYVTGASVKAEILATNKHKKVLVFKMKTRKNFKRLQGHRQHYSLIKVKEIVSGG
ncbi:MAG: 50S ribosomal protein L21 [Nitrospirae bacterium]|nr:50S ribosomal protein L21 [Nitrospirota bacterium]MBF0542236.1 50S ribosomal protein L21 [Nitrospirota bacterium]